METPHRRSARLAGLALAFALGWPGLARAEIAYVLDEVKFGVLAHDLDVRPGGPAIEHGVDVNAELLFVPLPLAREGWPPWARVAASPRPHLGGSLSASGYTSKLYFGLTWTAEPFSNVFTEDDGFWLAWPLGAAVHDGRVRDEDGSHAELGARILFSTGAEAGYRWGRASLSAFFDHVSNAGLGTHNQGLNDLGARVGWRF